MKLHLLDPANAERAESPLVLQAAELALDGGAAVATFRKQIRKGALKASQFPDTLTDAKGTITKPSNW